MGKNEIADETPQVEKKNQFQDNLKKKRMYKYSDQHNGEENREKKLTQKISINSSEKTSNFRLL